MDAAQEHPSGNADQDELGVCKNGRETRTDRRDGVMPKDEVSGEEESCDPRQLPLTLLTASESAPLE